MKKPKVVSRGLAHRNVITEFDSPWFTKYSIKCGRFSKRWASTEVEALTRYRRTYRLQEFLWKLKIWTP